MVKALLSGKQRKKRQLGFTLAEMVIAIAISAVVLVGSFELVSHMVITSAKDRANTMAMLQVQYVGFWITEDVVQARPSDVILGDAQGFPLTVEWPSWNGDVNKITYSVEGQVWTLSRHYQYTPNGGSVIDKGTVVVGESLVPAGTRCEWVTGGNATNVLKLEVTANVDGKVATRTYEINPRSK
jgi:prepilin-type N-terminal cleavage/methylation domain-containing protein